MKPKYSIVSPEMEEILKRASAALEPINKLIKPNYFVSKFKVHSNGRAILKLLVDANIIDPLTSHWNKKEATKNDLATLMNYLLENELISEMKQKDLPEFCKDVFGDGPGLPLIKQPKPSGILKRLGIK
jgi:hypothetical protein